MTPRELLDQFIESKGGIAAAARALDVPYQSLRGIAKGWRGVSRDYAETLARKSGGELDADSLVWIKATRKQGRAA